jgi:hypothetical protein
LLQESISFQPTQGNKHAYEELKWWHYMKLIMVSPNMDLAGRNLLYQLQTSLKLLFQILSRLNLSNFEPYFCYQS